MHIHRYVAFSSNQVNLLLIISFIVLAANEIQRTFLVPSKLNLSFLCKQQESAFDTCQQLLAKR